MTRVTSLTRGEETAQWMQDGRRADLRMEELGEKMTSSRNCELTMMLSTSIESEQEDTEKRHDECFLGQIFSFLGSKYLGERQPLASIAETESTWKI